MFDRFHAWLYLYRRAAARNCFDCHATIVLGTFLVDTGMAAVPLVASHWPKGDPGHFTVIFG